MNRHFTLCLAALAISFVPYLAIASNNNDDDDNNSPPIDISNNSEANAVAGAVAFGGKAEAEGGKATNTNVITNANTAKIEKGAVDVDLVTKNLNLNYNQNRTRSSVTDSGNSTNTNTTSSSSKQTQRQDQDQDQSQSQGIEGSGNSSINWQERRQTASAYSGSTTIANDSCGSSVGAGGQGPAFGFTLNFARTDEVCELLKLSRALRDYGYADAGKAILCQDDRVAEAFIATGAPCPVRQ